MFLRKKLVIFLIKEKKHNTASWCTVKNELIIMC